MRSERGSGTVLVVGVMSIVILISFAAVCIGGYMIASHRAQTAADLAALAGARAVVDGADVCQAARDNAAANRAALGDCRMIGDPQDFVVQVQAEVAVKAIVPGLPKKVTATAYAGSLQG